MRKFKYSFLEAIYHGDPIPDGVEIAHEQYRIDGMRDIGTVIIKIVDGWKFYRVYTKHNPLNDHLEFLDAKENEWSADDIIYCREVEPRVREEIYYKEVDDDETD